MLSPYISTHLTTNSDKTPTLSINLDPYLAAIGPLRSVHAKNAYTYTGKISSLISRIEKPFVWTKYGTKNGSDGLNQKKKQNEQRITRRDLFFFFFFGGGEEGIVVFARV